MVALLLQLIVIGAVLVALRSLYHRFLVSHALDNLPGPAGGSFLAGHLPQMFNRNAWGFHKQILQYGPVSVVKGLFGERIVFVFDPKAMHNIVVKDQYIYEETPLFFSFNRLFFGKGLLSSIGQEHRQQRKILNPVFNINHMRYMTPVFYRITHKLHDAVARQVKDGEKEIDMLNWMTRTALELIGQGGLGWSFDKLEKMEINNVAEYLKAFIPTISPLFLVMRFLPFLVRIGSASFRRKVIEAIPLRRVQLAISIADVLDRIPKEILASKKAALAAGDEALSQQIGEGKDIISVLLKTQMNASEEDIMTDEEILGQMSTFLFAAMETTSGALAHILHKLAEHQDIQDKLRQEISTARDGRDNIPYDELVAMPYMDAICRETLRLYPPVMTMNRKTTQDIVMPLSQPIRGKDGSLIAEVPLPKDTNVMIGIWGSNINPALWGEDAEVFKPERWLKPLPDTVTDAHIPGVYSNLMTFLGGGRACIGFKFSQLEMKVVLAVLIESFKFELPPDKEIYWNYSGVQYPSVGREDENGQLPMKVSLVKAS